MAKVELKQWLGPRVTEALKDAGETQDLENKAAWRTVCEEIRSEFRMPPGTSLETFTIREACRFEKRIEEVRLIQWWRAELAKAEQDGRLARAMAEKNVEKLLSEIGEERARSLLSRQERNQPAGRRLESYLGKLGLLEVLEKLGKVLDRLGSVLEEQQAELERQRQEMRELLANCFILGGQLIAAPGAPPCPQKDVLIEGARQMLKALGLPPVQIPDSLELVVERLLEPVRDGIRSKHGASAASAFDIGVFLAAAVRTDDPARAVCDARKRVQHLRLPPSDRDKLVALLSKVETEISAEPGRMSDIAVKVLGILQGHS